MLMRLLNVVIMNDAVKLFLVSLCVTVAPTFAQRSNHGLHLMIRDLLQSNDGFIPFIRCSCDDTDLPTRAPVSSSVVIDPLTERLHQVLIALGLPDSNDVSSFLEKFGNSHCDWTWVACDENEHATKIDISGLNLSGTIHPGIAKINTLEDILLSDNSLHGTIPHNMTNLYKLSKFIVDNNPDLGGSPDFLCDIETFSFTHTQIPYYTCAPTLRQVMMGLGVSESEMENKRHCDWPGVDCSSTNTNNVIGISLSFSDLSGTIDPVIGEIDTLEKIQLQNNQLRGTIPDEMQHMQSLSMFIVNDNPDLSGSPSFLCDLEVFLFINTKIPRYLCTSNLKKVFIGLGVSEAELVDELHCNWNGVTCHSETTVVKSINLSDSGLSGTIDPLIGELDGLEEIQLQYNELQGTIPDEMQHMQSLSTFIVDNNRDLSGSPDFLCDLEFFSFDNTKIPLYACFSALILKKILTGFGVNVDETETHCNWQGVTCHSGRTDVQAIDLRQSNLDGTINSAIGKLNTLGSLLLGQNNIYGSFPSTIGNMNSLWRWNFYGNELTGTIPTQIGRLSKLRFFSIGGNDLSSTIPQELWSLPDLEDFLAPGNELTGTIPSEIKNLKKLETLELRENQMSSTIPKEICQCPLIDLKLTLNEISGSIPTEIGECTDLKVLNLNLNQLTGSLPTEIGQMTKLERSTLNSLMLTGTIPQEMGDLTSLHLLNVDNNLELGGSPDFLCDTPVFTFANTNIPQDLCD